MPLFFFDVNGGSDAIENEGFEFSNAVAAQQTAIETLLKIAADEMTSQSESQNFTIVVRDANKHPIYCAALSFIGTALKIA